MRIGDVEIDVNKVRNSQSVMKYSSKAHYLTLSKVCKSNKELPPLTVSARNEALPTDDSRIYVSAS
ncbi:MAG: hypothetical protein ACTS8R_03925 [Arsenophonus sp. NC-QC1-MAG3]